ncbi:MAG: GGDEF domain-containing protein [Lachnospiraceae bacterium]|nr:GGDEF domain-containing protein [Lachnospiraceae bacterium]
MDKIVLGNLSKEEKKNFFQSKYEYYKPFNLRMVTVSTLAFMSFFVTDCSIFGHFAYETLLSRTIVLIPFILYLILTKKVSDYRIMVPVTYLVIHIIIWCTDWATYLLPDRQFAIPGMIIMNLIFVCAGFGAPFKYGLLAHLILLVDIAVADRFIHYDNVEMMFMFNAPCILAVGAMHHMMQGVYFEQYLAKQSLQKLAVYDQLSGVYNRNILKEINDPNTGKLTFAPGVSVGVLLIDIDFFKKVNDKYGHEAGDKVLMYLADIFKSNMRPEDYVIRWGGEEFLIIMPDRDQQQTLQIAKMLREKVEQSDNGVCKMTISVGAAMYNGGDYHETIKKADEAMYLAKNNGRNQVVSYEMSQQDNS